MLGFCGSWRFSRGWWCPSVVLPFGVVCGGVGWGDDNRTTTEGGDNEAAPPPGEVAGRCAAAVTGLAAAGAGRTEGMAGGAEAQRSGSGAVAGRCLWRQKSAPAPACCWDGGAVLWSSALDGWAGVPDHVGLRDEL